MSHWLVRVTIVTILAVTGIVTALLNGPSSIVGACGASLFAIIVIEARDGYTRRHPGRWWVIADRLDFGPMTVPAPDHIREHPYDKCRTLRQADRRLLEATGHPVNAGYPKLLFKIIDSKTERP